MWKPSESARAKDGLEERSTMHFNCAARGRPRAIEFIHSMFGTSSSWRPICPRASVHLRRSRHGFSPGILTPSAQFLVPNSDEIILPIGVSFASCFINEDKLQFLMRGGHFRGRRSIQAGLLWLVDRRRCLPESFFHRRHHFLRFSAFLSVLRRVSRLHPRASHAGVLSRFSARR